MANQIFSQILIYLTDFSGFIKKFTGDVGASGVHYDWLVIFFFCFAVLVIALSLGRSRMLLALLSMYAAVFFETNFLYFDKLRELFKNLPEYWLHLVLFLVTYGVVFAIINRSFLKHRLTLAESAVIVVVLIAIAEMGFLATILVGYFPEEWLGKIPPKFLPYLATEKAQFWWAVVPVLALIFSKGKKLSSARISP